MEYEAFYYSNKLKDTLVQKQRVNSSYSLRAFSRDLKMHPTTLSLVMQEKRPLPKKNLDYVIERLEMSPFEEAIFRESLESKKSTLDKIIISKEYQNRYILDESNYKVISEWEHYAVLTLMETDNFISNLSIICERLDISLSRLEVVIRNLETAKLIKKDIENNYVLTKGPLRTSEDISSKALKKSHKETIDMSKKMLDEVDLEFRDFSSMTLAVNPNKISEAKVAIREFRKKMASLLKEGEKTEVIQIAIQMYPLTNSIKEPLQ